MKLGVKLFLGVVAIFAMCSVISCSEEKSYNDRAVELCNTLTELMEGYTNELSDMLDIEDFTNMKELSENTDKQIDELYGKLNKIKVKENNQEFHSKITQYFDLSKKLVDMGNKLSTFDNFDDAAATQILNDILVVSDAHDQAIEEIIQYQEEFATKHDFVLEEE